MESTDPETINPGGGANLSRGWAAAGTEGPGSLALRLLRVRTGGFTAMMGYVAGILGFAIALTFVGVAVSLGESGALGSKKEGKKDVH